MCVCVCVCNTHTADLQFYLGILCVFTAFYCSIGSRVSIHVSELNWTTRDSPGLSSLYLLRHLPHLKETHRLAAHQDFASQKVAHSLHPQP